MALRGLSVRLTHKREPLEPDDLRVYHFHAEQPPTIPSPIQVVIITAVGVIDGIINLVKLAFSTTTDVTVITAPVVTTSTTTTTVTGITSPVALSFTAVSP